MSVLGVRDDNGNVCMDTYYLHEQDGKKSNTKSLLPFSINLNPKECKLDIP